MGAVFYIVGLVIVGYAGYSGLQWYFIFIASGIMAIGWATMRSSAASNIFNEDGGVGLVQLGLIQVLLYSIITAPVYFIASLIGG